MTLKAALASFALVLLVPASGCAASGSSGSGETRVAVLGIETEAPSRELAEELDLPFEVRQQCRVVSSVTGPAASAGLREGDVLYAIGDVDLYSQDDLDDVLRASRPGDEVVLALKRRGEPEVRKVGVVLGAGDARTSTIVWRHASFASLTRALEEGRSTGKNVLVGLSGAET